MSLSEANGMPKIQRIFVHGKTARTRTMLERSSAPPTVVIAKHIEV